MNKLIGYFKDEGYCMIFTNDPEILDVPVKNLHFKFVVPSYDKDEFLRRIAQRGEDTSSEWVMDVYNNYERYINEWRGIAKYQKISIVEAWYLSDVVS